MNNKNIRVRAPFPSVEDQEKRRFLVKKKSKHEFVAILWTGTVSPVFKRPLMAVSWAVHQGGSFSSSLSALYLRCL